MEHGWDVRPIDIVAPEDIRGTDYKRCDITDFEALRQQAHECDAIVHLAALRTPMLGPGHDVFRINTVGTFNVFEAAAQAGIHRVVQASSINAFGCAWAITDFQPRYFPIDEDHPSFTTDPYSFSKQQVEEIGAYFWRRDKISSAALRFPGVYRPDYYRSAQYYARRNAMRQFLDRFLRLAEDEQRRQLKDVRQQCLAFRAERKLEYPTTSWSFPAPEGVDENLWHAYTFDRYNLWTSVDVRDAVQSIEKSLTADFEGSYTLFVNDTHNALDYDSHTLARLFFPDVNVWKHPIAGSESLISARRAHEVLGFEPRYSLYGDHDD
jgi:nucleoside-diphosphate-sugar epimerase